jgi:predicted small secreted protein
METSPMRTFALASLLIASLALVSCNTAIGFGRDLRSLGEGMENSAYGRDWNGQQKAPSGQNSQQPVY